MKVDVRKAEHFADEAEKRFRVKREIRNHQARRVKSDDRLRVRALVFSASDRVGIIENRHGAAVVRFLHKRDDIARIVIQKRISVSVLKNMPRRVRHEGPAVLRGERLQSLYAFLPPLATDDDACYDKNNYESEERERNDCPEDDLDEPRAL